MRTRAYAEVKLLTIVSAPKMVRIAVVTGGNKGIGFAIVRGLCKQFDGDVILTARNPVCSVRGR